MLRTCMLPICFKQYLRYLWRVLLGCIALKIRVAAGENPGESALGNFNASVDDERFSLLTNASMWLGGGIITEFNDNITLDPNQGESDIILRPNLYCRVLKPLTEQNKINFIGRGGFTRYLKHPQYNANFVTISPDTALSLSCYVREIECVLTDQFSYLHDATTSPLLNKTVSYKRFENTVSLALKWPVNEKALASASLARGDTIADSKEFKSLSKTVYRASCSGSYRLFNALWVGATLGGYTEHYTQNIQNDNKGLSLSVDLRSTFSDYLSANCSLGWDKRHYQTKGSIGDTHGSLSTLTLRASLDHRLTPYTQHSLSISTVPESGFGSNFYTDTSVSYLIRTQVSQKVSSGLNLIYQYTQTSHVSPERSQRYFIVWMLDLNFLRNMAIAFQARHLEKRSNQNDKSYKENKLTLDVTYSI